jgi:hypothetical protein
MPQLSTFSAAVQDDFVWWYPPDKEIGIRAAGRTLSKHSLDIGVRVEDSYVW